MYLFLVFFFCQIVPTKDSICGSLLFVQPKQPLPLHAETCSIINGRQQGFLLCLGIAPGNEVCIQHHSNQCALKTLHFCFFVWFCLRVFFCDLSKLSSISLVWSFHTLNKRTGSANTVGRALPESPHGVIMGSSSSNARSLT